MATTTFPNGYGHGPRTHDESIALNTIDRPSVKVRDTIKCERNCSNCKYLAHSYFCGFEEPICQKLNISLFKNEPVDCNFFEQKDIKSILRIRKLTPKECMRLMAFQDCDTNSMYDCGLTNSAIYHCAGDSICVNVLIGVFAKLFGFDNIETENIIKEYIETIKEEL